MQQPSSTMTEESKKRVSELYYSPSGRLRITLPPVPKQKSQSDNIEHDLPAA